MSKRRGYGYGGAGDIASGGRGGSSRGDQHGGRRARRRSDDQVPHISWEPGLRLGPERRYIVETLLGDGATGRVLGCRDVESQRFVAVKVARPISRQRRHAEAEAEVLRRLERHDAEKCRRLCVRLLGTFEQAQAHLCLVFEPLALSLRGLLTAPGSQSGGLLLSDIRDITRQLLEGLGFMHSAGLAHTDLKCTNVMLRSGDFDLVPHPREPGDGLVARPRRRPCEAVLIDFGMAMTPTAATSSSGRAEVVRAGARHVRAPEVVLGLRWEVAIDLWSLGTLLYSLYTGDRLFRVHEDMEHLASMERICEARIPAELAREVAPRIAAKGVAFDASTGRLAWPGPAASREATERVESLPTLRESILPEHKAFFALIKGLLELRPGSRLTAAGALQEAFFRKDGEEEAAREEETSEQCK